MVGHVFRTVKTVHFSKRHSCGWLYIATYCTYVTRSHCGNLQQFLRTGIYYSYIGTAEGYIPLYPLDGGSRLFQAVDNHTSDCALSQRRVKTVTGVKASKVP
jgi:hypothetical protein